MDSHANEYGFSLNVPVRPTPTPAKPRQHNKKPPPNQQVLSFKPKTVFGLFDERKTPEHLFPRSLLHIYPLFQQVAISYPIFNWI